MLGTHSNRYLTLVAVLALGLLIVGAAQGRERNDHWSRPTPPPASTRHSTPHDRVPGHAGPISRGFVFIDGQYVAGPYIVEKSDTGATINGHAVQWEESRETPSPEPMLTNAGPWNGNVSEDRQHRRRSGPPAFVPPRQRPDQTAKLRRDLLGNAVVVSFTGQPLVVLQQRVAEEMLRIALRENDSSGSIGLVLGNLPPSANQQQWNQWLTNYKASPALVTNAAFIVDELERIELSNNASVVANRRLHYWAYPLTVFGMVMSVVSLGHLLKSAPKDASLKIADEERALFVKATIFSLGLVVVLSMLDLFWTILASQAGQMHEINPIGSHLMENTALLSAFKVGATVFSCGILLMLRKHFRAQWAAWWLCLICTVLTFRWLVLNSMFVT